MVNSELQKLVEETLAKQDKEVRYRAGISLLLEEYGYAGIKSNLRAMVVGYYVNDNGLAITPPDEHGQSKPARFKGRPEVEPGEFLIGGHVEALYPYGNCEVWREAITGKPAGKRLWCPLVDRDGNVVAKIYKDDTAAIKEILENWDIPIGDPINRLYTQLSAFDEGDLALPEAGLRQFAGTIVKAENKLEKEIQEKERLNARGPRSAPAMDAYMKELQNATLVDIGEQISKLYSKTSEIVDILRRVHKQ